MLGHPSADPHGDPIPDREGTMPASSTATLLACPLNQPQRVVRVGDQSSEFLRLLEKRGLVPGSRVEVESRSEAADSVELENGAGERLSLGFRAASKIFVEPARG
jgi:DtxR family Mn-dependent transcriptional regulator